MVSTCVDPVLHDLELLMSNICEWGPTLFDVRNLQEIFRLLRTFLLSVRKWRNNDVYIECNDKRKRMSLQSLVSSTEDTVKKYAVDIHSLLGKQSELNHFSWVEVAPKFKESIKSIMLEIIKAYTVLLDSSSLQSGPCMRDDELVELVDSLVQSLADFRHSVVEALEYKLIFLKNLVRFSILRGVELGQLEDLLTCILVVSLNVARLCYTCEASRYEFVTDSLAYEQIRNIEPFDLHLCETCVKVLRASKSSANLQSIARDKDIMLDFNDSLISHLWEIGPVDAVNDQLELLYTGLLFFRNILRGPQEKMDRLNEKIGALISEAGVIICSLSVNQVKEGEVNSLEVRDALDCDAMLVNINSGINLIKDQISGSSMMGGLPSHHSFKEQAVPKSSSIFPSKHKTAVTHEVVVGFDDEAKTVVDRLIGGTRQLEVVPIVGMPGLGKTTLAKEVNKHDEITSHFHIRLWCCVSQVYGRKNLLLQLLCDDDKYFKKEEDDLLQELYQNLKGKRYLIIFDDVWDIGFWNDLRLSFPNEANGSRILFTSRFSDVASQVEFGKEPHNLRSLTESESWELLQKKVFGNEDCPRELCILGKEIAKNCKGLPLTIVIIAGVLATIEYDGWAEVAKDLTSSIAHDTDLCKITLEMSYENLPDFVKPCFLYFGAFPEDQEIETEKLMRLWIAEGFVQETESKRLEDVAGDYMKNLIDKNLIMVSRERSVSGVKACRIHDLLHEFCKSKAREENFLLKLQAQDELYIYVESPNLQRLSICSKPKHFEKSRIICSNLSSLLLFDPVHAGLQTAEILFICRFCRQLTVLDLVAYKIYDGFPVELNELVQLRYLAMECHYIDVIPPSVVNLSNLETILVRVVFSDFVSLPETIWNMKKLRHLHIGSDCNSCGFLEGTLDSSSSLHNLDTFSRLEVSSTKSLEEIVKKIPNVRQLEIEMEYHGRQSHNLSLDSLNQLESLESLNCSFYGGFDYFVDDFENPFPSTLKKLTLQELRLPWSKISLIDELPNLEVLKLLDRSFKGKRWDMKGGEFPKLRVLRVEELDVVEWTDTDCDGNCFPSLEKLQLILMGELKKVPSCLESIGTLKTIEVEKHANDNGTIDRLVRGIAEVQQDYGNESLEVWSSTIPNRFHSYKDSVGGFEIDELGSEEEIYEPGSEEEDKAA